MAECRARLSGDFGFKVRCEREQGHDGRHEGLAYDQFGPKGPWWWRNDKETEQ